MRTVMMCLAAASVALAAVAVSAGASPALVYSPADLARIVDPTPTLSGWSFVRGKKPLLKPAPAHDPAFTLHELLLANSPPPKWYRAYLAALKKAGFVIGRELHWVGRPKPGRNPARITVEGWLFRTAAGAQKAWKVMIRRPNSTPATVGLGSDTSAESQGKIGRAHV